MVLYRVSILSRIVPPRIDTATETLLIEAQLPSGVVLDQRPTPAYLAIEHLARLPDGACALDTTRYLETGVLDDVGTRLYVFEEPVKPDFGGSLRQWDIVYGFVCATTAPKLLIAGREVPLTLENGVYRIGKGGLICLVLQHSAKVVCADPYTILGIQLPDAERRVIARSGLDIHKFT